MYQSDDVATTHTSTDTTSTALVPTLTACATPLVTQSPSIRVDRTPAYEMKFLLNASTAAALEALVQRSLLPDPHGDPEQGHAYHLTTLYCDTLQHDVFHRVGRYRHFKCRVRRYGQSQQVFLERKCKYGCEVRKRRVSLPLDRLADFVDQHDLPGDVGWYQRVLRRNALVPTCLLSYTRLAYYGLSSEGPLRLTFDADIRGALADEWNFALPAVMPSLLPDVVVVEFKYRQHLPALFKQWMHALQLMPTGASKYRRCLEVAGIATEGSRA